MLNTIKANLKSLLYANKDAKPTYWNTRKYKHRPTQVRVTKMFVVIDKGMTSAYFPKEPKQKYCPFVMDRGQGYVKKKVSYIGR
tara:strand:+ start:262 stop:513 length:252 start_codon:yes stop_codon:yes gene_type:complete